MSNSSSPFKSYDIRGLVGSEIDVTFAETLGGALERVIVPKTCLVGFDMRTSSPDLAKALVGALRKRGVDCIDIGLCTTPVFYHAVATRPEVDLGVMITASHNPSTYNGFKLCRKNAVPIGFGSGMEEIRDAFLSKEQKNGSNVEGGYRRVESAIEDYLEAVLARLPDEGASFHSAKPGSLKVVIDAGNGMAGASLPALGKRLPVLDLVPLYWELDGTFPNHEANPLRTDTLVDLQNRVVKEGALVGFAFDGDGDRIGVVDERGEIVPGDILTGLLAQELLPSHPGARVFYDLRCSWSTPEMIAEAGGVPEMCRVGHAHIKKQMREAGALFAGELAMHFYFAPFANCEASEYAMLLLLQLLQRTGKPLSELWKPFHRYAHSGECNYTVTEAAADVLTRVRTTYESQASQVTVIDGLRYEFRDPANPGQDWWFSVRSSNTEPLIRLNLEARTKDVMRARLKEVEYAIIGANGSAPSTH